MNIEQSKGSHVSGSASTAAPAAAAVTLHAACLMRLARLEQRPECKLFLLTAARAVEWHHAARVFP